MISTIDKINRIEVNFRSKPKLVSKNNTNHVSKLNAATKDVLDCFVKHTSKIQNSYEKVLNNWLCEHKEAFTVFFPVSTVVAFFSKDKSEKLIIDNGTALLEDKKSNKSIFSGDKWIGEDFNIEQTLIEVINNNIIDVDEKAKIMYSLSDACLNKLLENKDASSDKLIIYINNLLDCVTNIYNFKQILEKFNKISEQKIEGYRTENLIENGAELLRGNNVIYSIWNNGDEIYEFEHKNNTKSLPIKYQRKSEPKYSMKNRDLFSEEHSEVFYDAQDNLYEKNSDLDVFTGAQVNRIRVNIKDFGLVERRFNSGSPNSYKYLIKLNGKDIKYYEYNRSNGETKDIESFKNSFGIKKTQPKVNVLNKKTTNKNNNHPKKNQTSKSSNS